MSSTKQVTVGSICSWFFGIVFLFGGIAQLSEARIFSAFLYCLLGFILIPPLSQKLKINISGELKAVLVILVLIIGGRANSGAANTDIGKLQSNQVNAVADLPKDEAAFIQMVAEAQGKSVNAENDMQRGGIKAERDRAICKIMRKLQIKNWVGTISTIDANSDGKGVFGIEIAKDVIIGTHNNDFSDSVSNDNTLLDPQSQFFKAVSNLKVGQQISFSGSFRPGTSTECIEEDSLTLSGKLSAPEFIFRFSSIAVPTLASADSENRVPAKIEK